MTREQAAAQFRGVIATPITPFNDDFSLDVDGVESNVDALLVRGAEGFVVCGSIGELPTLTADEWQQVVQSTVAVTSQQCPVYATVGHTDLREAIRMVERAAVLGCTGVVVVPPFYYSLARSEIVDFYRHIDRAGVPFVVYNHPGTGRPEIDTDTVGELAAMDNFAGLKEATANANEFRAKRAMLGGRFNILAAAESHLFSMGVMGIDGCLTAVSAFMPSFLKPLMIALAEDDLQEARRINNHLMVFRDIVHALDATGTTGYLVVTKAATELAGLKAGPPRPCLSPLAPDMVEKLALVVRDELGVV